VSENIKKIKPPWHVCVSSKCDRKDWQNSSIYFYYLPSSDQYFEKKKVCENKNKITMAWGKKIRKNIYIVNLVKNFYHYDISSYIPNACLVLVVTFPCTCKHSFLYSLCMVSTPSTLLFMEQFMKHSIFKANNKTILHV